jgi:hypothetical protein
MQTKIMKKNNPSCLELLPLIVLLFACAHSQIQAQSTNFVSTVTNTPNLLGYWRFDPPSLTNSLTDGFIGTNEFDAVIGPSGSGSPLEGYPSNEGLVLDGNAYFETDLIGLLTNQFTLMCWLNISNYPGNGLDNYSEIIDQQQFADDCDLILFPDGTVHFYTDQGGNLGTTTPIPTNEWHFLVGTASNGGNRCIYLDGQLVAQNSMGSAQHRVSTSPFVVGYGLVFTPRHFYGTIDEVAVFNRALTPAEVTTIYVSSLGGLQSIDLSVSAQMPIGQLQATVKATLAKPPPATSTAVVDITQLATYSSSDSNVVTVGSSGLITALQLGSARITASYGGQTDSQTVTVVPATPLLTHRYSFSGGNANDLVGTANGTLQGGATFTGEGLSLAGNGDVSLPSGTIDSNYYAFSVEMWANIQRTPSGTVNVISAFGNPSNSYVRLGTHDGNGDGNAWIGDFNGFFESDGYQPGPIAGNVHLVGVWNPVIASGQAAGTMEFYLNGYPLNSNFFSGSLTSIASLQDISNVIGANIDGTDPLTGIIQEYRVYQGALTLAQIRTSLAAGPANPPLVSGQINPGIITNVSVTTHGTFIVGTIQDPVVKASSATVQNIDLTTLTSVALNSSDSNVLVVLPNNQVQAVSAGTATLTATYLGVSGHTLVTTVVAPSLTLTHRYSFVTDASDAISGENGTLMGNATASNGLSLNQEGDGNGNGDYLWLPRDLVAGYPALTIEAWVNLTTQEANYPRIWTDGSWTFGGGTDSSAMLLSPDYPGPSLTLLTSPENGIEPNDEMDLPADAAGSSISIQNAGLVQIVGVLDPQTQHIGALYYNGQLAAAADFMYPLTQVIAQHCFVGKSASVNDPLLIGTVNELRFYYGAMTAGQVASNYAAGTTNVAVSSGAAQITDQPAPQTVLAGSQATFSVGTEGLPPLEYQWFLGSMPIAGATDATYIIQSASDANAGAYTVQVSNSLSVTSVVSAGAVLTVDHLVDLTNGLIVHLPFDFDYDDISGNTNDAYPGGSPEFIPGKVGTGAIHVNTAPPIFNYVAVSNSASFSFASNFTVSFWQRHTGFPNDLPMAGIARNSTYNGGWVVTDDGGRFEATLGGASGFIPIDPSPGPIINDGQWHQVGMVINQQLADVEMYVDGVEVYSKTTESLGENLLGDLSTGNILTLGSDPTGKYGVTGEYDLDDFCLWNRALEPVEMQTVYTLGQSGQSLISGYAPQTLSIQSSSGFLQLNWSSGILQSAPTVLGPWSNVTNATPPSYQMSLPAGTNSEFFRVQLSGSGVLP